MLQNIKNILNSQFYALSLYARTIAGTLVLFVIARYLSVYDYGLFSSYKNIASFCLLLANPGFADYILVSSKANTKEVKLKISLFLVNAMFIGLLTCCGGYFFNIESRLLFCLVVIRTFFDGTFFGLIIPYFQASKKFNIIATINIIYSLLIIGIALISYIFKLSLIKFLILNIILGSINFIQCSYYAKINYFLLFNNFKKFFKMLDKSIFAYMGVTIAYLLYAQIPSLYVSTCLSKELAALYFSAFTIATVVSLIIGAQVQKMTPEMIKATTDEVKLIIKKNLLFIVTITFAIFIFMLFFGKIILLLFYGQDYYKNAYPVLLILMLGNIGVAIAAVYGAYITASGNQKKKIPMQLNATLITVIGLLFLHKYGIYGASVSFLLSSIYIAYKYTTVTKKMINYQKIL